MTTPTPVLMANLGWFAAFMPAYGRADQPTRDLVYQETLDYRAGRIDGPTELREVAAALNIPPPATA